MAHEDVGKSKAVVAFPFSKTHSITQSDEKNPPVVNKYGLVPHSEE